jgi:hypothetical protein
MNRLISFLISIILVSTAHGQRSYDQAMQQADAAFKRGEYKMAIAKYFAAEAFEPSKKAAVKLKLNKAFDAIQALCQKAENDKTPVQKKAFTLPQLDE